MKNGAQPSENSSEKLRSCFALWEVWKIGMFLWRISLDTRTWEIIRAVVRNAATMDLFVHFQPLSLHLFSRLEL
jgi:hypothetical protein